MSVAILGANGMVGSALARRMPNALQPPRNLDLRRQEQVEAWFEKHLPEAVFLAAAKVGGIKANSEHPAPFIYDNLMIQANVIHAAHATGVKKLLFLGSSCIYPKYAAQPIVEEELLSGPLEPTNKPYAVAKIAGIELCQAYRRQYGFSAISLMPTNLYGPGDRFSDEGHVIAGLMARFHAAKEGGDPVVKVWGTGEARREFLHADDLADACIFAMENYDSDLPLNVGTGEDLTISSLAAMIAIVVGYDGQIEFEPCRPDGTPRKLLDVSRMTELGWRPRIGLLDGLRSTYIWYRAHLKVAA